MRSATSAACAARSPRAVAHAPTAAGQVGEQRRLDQHGRVREPRRRVWPARRPSPSPRRPAWCRSWRTRRGARPSPDPTAPTRSPGTCCGRPGPPPGRPQSTPRMSSRCSRCDRRSPFGVRRSSSTTTRSDFGVSRAARCAAATSRASGTCGAAGGTSPMASPTVRLSMTDGNAPVPDGPNDRSITVPAASSTSVEPGPRPVAERGQGVGEAGRADQVVGRRRQALGAQRRGGVDEEAGDALRARVPEHVAVPARVGDAGGVPRASLQPAVAPRHPRDRRLRAAGAGTAQRRRIGRRRGRRRVERRNVPGPAHHGDRAAARRGRRGSPAACAPRVERRAAGVAPSPRTAAIASATASNAGPPSPRCSTTSSHHRSGSGSPAASASARSGSAASSSTGIVVGQRRVAAERPAHRHVDRHRRDAVPERPADRLPLGAELGERPERGLRHVGRDVAEQRHRRHEPVVGDPAQQRLGVGRQLDEHRVGPDLVERREHRPRRPRPVMPDPEEVQPLVGPSPRDLSRVRDTLRRSRSSRRGHAPPPRGTRATPRRPGPGRARPRRRCRRRGRRRRAFPCRSAWPGPARS